MIVVDASVLLTVLMDPVGAPVLTGRVFHPAETLHAPHLLDVEVAQVARRYCRSGEMSGERGAQLLGDLADLRITRYPHALMLPRIWELRGNLTAYDAAYLALAEVLGAPLLTRDAKLAKALGHGAMVELV
jgi:predicted nucleic acid-binding protein